MLVMMMRFWCIYFSKVYDSVRSIGGIFQTKCLVKIINSLVFIAIVIFLMFLAFFHLVELARSGYILIALVSIGLTSAFFAFLGFKFMEAMWESE